MDDTLGRQRTIIFLSLIAIMAIGAILRLWELGNESAYSDEVASLQHLSAPTLTEFLRRERISDPPMTPLFFILEYGWARVTGGSLYGIRLLSVALGLSCIPLLFVLSREFYGAAGGLAAAGLFSVSLTQVYYAQEVRPYALILLLALVSGLSLWRAAHGGRLSWAVNALANMALMWTHLFTVLFLLAQGSYLALTALRDRRPMRAVWWVLAHAPSTVLLALWVRSMDHASLEVAAAWRHGIVHSYLQPLGDFLLFAGAGVPIFRDVPAIGAINAGSIMWRFYAAVLLLNLLLTGLHWRKAAAHAEDSRRLLSLEGPYFLWTWTLAPTIILFLFSALVYACHSSRYVLYSSIPFCILAGGTVALLRRRTIQALLAAALLLANVLVHVAYPRPWRPDITGAAHFLAKQDIPPETPVVVHIMADVPSMSFNGPPAVNKLRLHGENTLDDVVHYFSEAGPGKETRWLVVFQHQLSDRAIAETEDDIEKRGWSLEKTAFGYANPIYVYRVCRNTPVP